MRCEGVLVLVLVLVELAEVWMVSESRKGVGELVVVSW